MALKIRLARAGTKKKPFYRVVIAEASAPRDGRFVERVGTYDPRLPKDNVMRVVLKKERIEYWTKVGAQPTERVALLMAGAEMIQKPATPQRPQKSAPKKKAQERAAEKAEKLKAAKEAEAAEKAAAKEKAAEEKAKAAEESEKPKASKTDDAKDAEGKKEKEESEASS
jgi:small subunit ribosomal protein S16